MALSYAFGGKGSDAVTQEDLKERRRRHADIIHNGDELAMRLLKRRIAELEDATVGKTGVVVVFGGGQSQEEVDAFLHERGVDPIRSEVCVFHTIYEDENGEAQLPLRPLEIPRQAA